MAMAPGGRTMSSSSGAVGAVMSATGGVGDVARNAPLDGDTDGARDGRGAARRGGVGVVVHGRPDGGNGRRTGNRPRFRGLVHGRVGDDDGGDDVAVAHADGSRLCGVGPTRAQDRLAGVREVAGAVDHLELPVAEAGQRPAIARRRDLVAVAVVNQHRAFQVPCQPPRVRWSRPSHEPCAVEISVSGSVTAQRARRATPSRMHQNGFLRSKMRPDPDDCEHAAI